MAEKVKIVGGNWAGRGSFVMVKEFRMVRFWGVGWIGSVVALMVVVVIENRIVAVMKSWVHVDGFELCERSERSAAAISRVRD